MGRGVARQTTNFTSVREGRVREISLSVPSSTNRSVTSVVMHKEEFVAGASNFYKPGHTYAPPSLSVIAISPKLTSKK